MDEEFSYVIARPWDETDPTNLCIYTFHHEIHNGTEQEARDFLNYVNRQDPDKKYRIYKITYTEIKTNE